MAENPDTWGPVEKAVHQALLDHAQDMAQGVIGGTNIKAVADAVRKAVLDEIEQKVEERKRGVDTPNAMLQVIRGVIEETRQ